MNNGGIYHYNLTNKSWHENNSTTASILFKFSTFDKTLEYVKVFFTNMKISLSYITMDQQKNEK